MSWVKEFEQMFPSGYRKVLLGCSPNIDIHWVAHLLRFERAYAATDVA